MTDASWAAFAIIGAALITALAAYLTKRAEVRDAARRARDGDSLQQRAQLADEAERNREEGERLRVELRAEIERKDRQIEALRHENGELEADRDSWYEKARTLRRERDDAWSAIEQMLSLGKADEQ